MHPLPPRSPRGLTRLGAAAAVSALAVSGLALAGPAAQAADAEVVLTPVAVDVSATRAAGHNDFTADGVRVWTESATASGPNPTTAAPDDVWNTAKAAGYFDVDVALADAGEPAMDWTNNTPADNYRPGMQLKVDFNGDGDIDGILVGEPIMADGSPLLGNRWWLAGGADRKADLESPGVALPLDAAEPAYRGNIATLDGWRALFPDARVLQSGWSLGSGAKGDGVIHSITVGDTDYSFSNAESSSLVEVFPNDVVHTDTRATGHNEFLTPAGVRVWTEGTTSTDKATGYFDVDQPLRTAGEPSMAWTANGPNTHRPGMQLVVDVDDDGTPDGILVGEPVWPNGSSLYKDIALATNWWLTNGSTQAFKDLAPSTDGGNGSGLNGTLAEWRAALPADAVITQAGWSLGSGVRGDGVIQSITVGTTTYTFTGRNRAPVATSSHVSLPSGTSTTIELGGSDADGDPLTYTVGGAVVPGGVLTYTAKAGQIGSRVIAFTVADDKGATSAGIVVVSVVKAASTATLVLKPKKLSAKKNAKAKATITSTGLVDGGAVLVKVDGRKAGTATVKNGKVLVKLGKLAKGTHTLTLKFKGTDSAHAVVATSTFKVKR